MSRIKWNRGVIPPWDMPSDPVKAVFWFLYWLLQVLARFFWILILVGVIFETLLNGIIGALGTLLIGLLIWAVLGAVLLFFKMGMGITRIFEEVNRIQRGFPFRNLFYTSTEADTDGNVVEGTVTDLEEERRKRRQQE